MAGWDDLVADAQPALLGGGLIHEGFTEGTTWTFELYVTDSTNTPVDWTDVTGEGLLYADRIGDAAVALALDVTFPAAGRIVIRKEYTDTADLANQNSALGIFLTKTGSPNEKIAICLPSNSPCPIRSKN